MPPQVNIVNLNINPTQVASQEWYPDSGVSHHVTSNVTNILNLTIYTRPDQLYVRNGQGLTIHPLVIYF